MDRSTHNMQSRLDDKFTHHQKDLRHYLSLQTISQQRSHHPFKWFNITHWNLAGIDWPYFHGIGWNIPILPPCKRWYWRQFLVRRISGCVKVVTPQRVAQKNFDSSFPFMALNKSGIANDRKYPKPKEDI